MKITGIHTEEVEIEVSPDQVMNALWTMCGLHGVKVSRLHYSSSFYKKEIDKAGNPQLVEYNNVSYHGLPNYRPTGEVISDPAKLKAYEQLCSLEETIKEIRKS